MPTVTSLLSEIDGWDSSSAHPQTEKISDWEKTSLEPYIKYFKRHIDFIIVEERALQKRKNEEIGGMAISDGMIDF